MKNYTNQLLETSRKVPFRITFYKQYLGHRSSRSAIAKQIQWVGFLGVCFEVGGGG